MNIIEKLQIMPIRSVPLFKGQADCDICKAYEVREKEKVFNEMLEALIDIKTRIESYKKATTKPNQLIDLIERDCIVEVKKATGKSWEEIKELIK